jgi:neutral ceramidase
MTPALLERYIPILVALLCACTLRAEIWKAGAARVEITPEDPIWMAGYGVRDGPARGTLQPLSAKALALEDGAGRRLVLVTADLIGFPAGFTDGVAARLAEPAGLSREEIFFNASHTHAGPALAGNLEVAHPMSSEQRAEVERYTRRLEDRLVEVASLALDRMVPARLFFGETEVHFAANRRVPTPDGYRIAANRLGPVDHRVPFLAVDSLQGRLLAVVFGYACHSTTLVGDNYRFHGDYPGVAQEVLESRFDGANALFLAGTGGDANPYPRGTPALAEEHGRELAGAVARRLTGPLTPVNGPLQAAFDWIDLPFARLPSRPELEERLESGGPHLRRHAALMLDRLRLSGSLPAAHRYPIQVVRFGGDLMLVGLAGEVVVDYGLRLQAELASGNTWIAGYSNEVSCYIPSARVLAEGGYEAEDSMIYYGQPSTFDPSIEERIVAKVLDLADKLTTGEQP